MLERRGFRFCLEVHPLYLDQGGMNFPFANPLELGELFFRRFDCPFNAGRRSNYDRPLAAAEKLIVSGDFVHETDAVARHLSSSQSS
jgi:hypothetical protein